MLCKCHKTDLAPSITIIILARNEEGRIADAIENAKRCCDDVLVIDSQSEDRTAELSRLSGARVVTWTGVSSFAEVRNFAMDQTEADWVLFLDADERLNDQLIQAIQEAVKKNTDKKYVLLCRTVCFGHQFRFGPLRPDRYARMFPRKKVVWEGMVHERAICPLPSEQLPGFMVHYTFSTWNAWITKLNLYSSLWAQNAYAHGKRTSLFNAFYHATAGFFTMLFFKGGIFDGPWGIVFCLTHFISTFMKYLKLLELQTEKSNIPLQEETSDHA